MSITLDLMPEVEAQLRERAAREGLPPEVLASCVLGEALRAEAIERAEAVEGVRRGLEDSRVGRLTPLKEWDARMRARHGIPADAIPLRDEEAVQLP